MKYSCKRKRIQWFLICCVIYFIMQTVTVIAANNDRMIRYNGKKYVYSKSSVNICINDQEIDTPFGGLIIDDIALVPAKYTFAKSELGVEYHFNSNKKLLTLKTEEHEVKLQLNKSYMYVDGEKKELDRPAVKIYDIQKKKASIMVPGRNVAEALGFVYEWKESIVSSCIYSKDYWETKGNDPTEEEEEIPKNYTLKIKKSDDMGYHGYEVKDNYWEKEYIISLDDDYTEFYKNNPVQKKKNNIKNIKVGKDENQCTSITITTDKIQGFKLIETEDAIYVITDIPQKIYDKIVVIDPGHGGTDPGAKGNGIIEKDKTLEIAKYVEQYFAQEENVKVYFTRLKDSVSGMTAGSAGVKDSHMSLPARYRFANEISADLFVSIHINSFDTSSPNGTEVFYSAKNTSKNEWGMTSKEFATRMQKAIQKVVGRQNRGVKENGNLAVLTHTDMPAILIETAFLTNPIDVKILKDSNKMEEVGEAIYTVIMDTFE